MPESHAVLKVGIRLGCRRGLDMSIFEVLFPPVETVG